MWCEYYIVLIFDILISRLLTLSNPKDSESAKYQLSMLLMKHIGHELYVDIMTMKKDTTMWHPATGRVVRRWKRMLHPTMPWAIFPY